MLLEERGLLDAALESAAEAGVEQIVSVGLDVEDSDRNRVIAESPRQRVVHRGLAPAPAPRPRCARRSRALDELLGHPRAVAVGEIGIDLYFRPGYHETPLDEQRVPCTPCSSWPQAHRKPVVVHDRDAHDEVLAAIREHPGRRAA